MPPASILSSVASFERETTVERIKAGMAAAKSRGRDVGRPRADKKLNQIRRMYDQGAPAQEIADKLKCTGSNVYVALAKTAHVH